MRCQGVMGHQLTDRYVGPFFLLQVKPKLNPNLNSNLNPNLNPKINPNGAPGDRPIRGTLLSVAG